MRHSRRAVLATGAGLLTSGIAGCLGSPISDDDGDGEPSGSAAFFALQDWGNQIVGDLFSFDTPVETGEMGHGWDPDGDIIPQISQNDVFLYLHTPEFQWAINIASELESDDYDTIPIDAMQAISSADFLPFTDEEDDLLPDPDEDVEYDLETLEIAEFDVIFGDDVTAWWHDDHWHGGMPDVPVGDTIQLFYTVKDADGNVLPLGEDALFGVETTISDGAPTDLLSIEDSGESTTVTGEETGLTQLNFSVLGDDEVLFDTSSDPISLNVREPDDVDVDAFHDPHVWVDPVHAQTMVDYIAAELGEIYPDHADTFTSNATSYIEELDAVHDQFEALVDNAELDVAVLVAHDAFQYLENRYGFTLETPVGVTPDAAESIRDVAELEQTIEEHEIDTILFDPFEAPDPDTDIPQTAQVLLDDSPAEHAEPLSPTEGTTPQWQEAGYGWVDQMTEINLPSLRRALRAE